MGTNGEKQERERQAALKQALRREVNERRTQGGEDGEVVRFLCECSDPACEELVSLTMDEYEFIRRIPSVLSSDRATCTTRASAC